MKTCAVIIPALLLAAEDDVLLRSTVEKVPWRECDELILVTHVNKPSGWIESIRPPLKWKHFDSQLTKWGAVEIGRQEVSPEVSRIVLIDDDDPLSESSIQNVWQVMDKIDFDLLVGQRRRISLRATDELSPNSRLYLEILANTLLLLQLGEVPMAGKVYPDIQSGFYVLNVRSCSIITFADVHAYGGELTMYYQIAAAKRRIVQVPIEPRPSPVSDYNLRQIVKDIFELPFFSCIGDDLLKQAVHAAPLMYSQYLTLKEISNYSREIERIIALR